VRQRWDAIPDQIEKSGLRDRLFLDFIDFLGPAAPVFSRTPPGGTQRRSMGRIIRIGVLLLVWVFISLDAGARPEKIRAGESYYSDEVVEVEGVRDLGEDMNYEEVYQFYRYYEAIYDEAGRVVVFIEYVRGDVHRRDEYEYGPDGKLVEQAKGSRSN